MDVFVKVVSLYAARPRSERKFLFNKIQNIKSQKNPFIPAHAGTQF